jgi:protein involved in sex pheromone biosynthesis
MKTKNLLTLLTLVCLIFSGCDKAIESKTEISAVQTVSMDSLITDDNFDEKMEKWFVEFNQAQDRGLDMNEANAKAITIAGVELENNNAKLQTLTANVEESTEQ